MNILRIVYDWPDENNITEGLAPAPYELSVAQSKLGHKIYVLCGNLNGKNLIRRRFSYSLEDGRIVVFNLPRGLAKLGPFLTTSVAVLPYYFYLKFKGKIGLVHNHGHLGVWFLLYKFLFGWLDKTKVIGHYHITAKGREEAMKAREIAVPFFSKYFEYPIHRFSDFLMSKVSLRIVAVSQDVIKEAQSYYGVNDSKIYLLESAVNTDRFKREGKRENIDAKADSVVIANGGRLSKRKNIDVLAKCLKFLPQNFVLVLWGPWDESFKKDVYAIVEKENLQDRFKYLGIIPYFEVDKYYRFVDIFVLPSSYEGLPKVVIEALASGCKVIASGFKADKEIPDLHMMQISEIKPENLAELIKKVYAKSSSYHTTRSIIEKYYSWDSKAKMLEEIITIS